MPVFSSKQGFSWGYAPLKQVPPDLKDVIAFAKNVSLDVSARKWIDTAEEMPMDQFLSNYDHLKTTRFFSVGGWASSFDSKWRPPSELATLASRIVDLPDYYRNHEEGAIKKYRGN